MSCNTDCTTLVSIPGTRGRVGEDGTDGANGLSAFTLTTANFTMPAELANVTVSVQSSSQFAVGMLVFISTAGTFQVVSAPTSTSIQLTNLEDTANGLYAENATPGAVIASGQTLTPTGKQGNDGNDPAGGTYFAIANNLSEGNPALMRSNLGILGMGLQDPANVAITGGSIFQLTQLTPLNAAAKKLIFNNFSPLTTKGDLLTHNGTDNVRKAVSAAASRVPVTDGAGDWSWQPISNLLNGVASQLVDSVGSGGAPQVIALGAWTALTLNLIYSDLPGNITSLVANRFVLAAGTYLAFGLFDPEQVYCRSRLYSVTTGLPVFQSVQARVRDNTTMILPTFGIFTVAAGQLLEWQYYALDDGGGGNFGYAMTTGDNEIYKSLTLLKIS